MADDTAIQRNPSIGRQLLDVPIGKMIRQLGLSIAEAQLALDLSSAETAQMMSGASWTSERDDGGVETRDPVLVRFSDGNAYSLMELGFTPTFYQFVDTVIEVKIAIRFTTDVSETQTSKETSSASSRAKKTGMSASASTVDAAYTGKYGYSAEGSSLIRTKLVPVPPPALLEERIRRLMEHEAERVATEAQGGASKTNTTG